MSKAEVRYRGNGEKNYTTIFIHDTRELTKNQKHFLKKQKQTNTNKIIY